MSKLRVLQVSSLWLLVSLGGFACASPAEKQALDGLEAFKRCDMRTAHDRFSSAYELDSRADFALAFALSDLALIAEDPAVKRLLPRFGFTGPLNSDFLFRADGLFDRLSRRTQTCDSIGDFLRANIPHPSTLEPAPEVESYMDPTLEFQDIEVAALELSPRLERLVVALERAADGMGEPTALEGGCGMGSVRIQKTELYVLAAWLEAVRGAVSGWAAYDGHLPVLLAIQDGRTSAEQTALVDALNAHLLRVLDASKLEAARPTLQHALALGRKAVGAARQTTSAPAGAMFDWSRFPRPILDDMDLYLQVATEGLTKAGPIEVPLLSPKLSVDLDSLVSRPFSTTELSVPAFYLRSYVDAYVPGGEVTRMSIDTRDELLATLGRRFSPNPWEVEGGLELTFAHEDAWHVSDDTWRSVFNPADRWGQAFDCRSTLAPDTETLRSASGASMP